MPRLLWRITPSAHPPYAHCLPELEHTDIGRIAEADLESDLPCPAADGLNGFGVAHAFGCEGGDILSVISLDMHLSDDGVELVLFHVWQTVSGTTVVCSCLRHFLVAFGQCQ